MYLCDTRLRYGPRMGRVGEREWLCGVCVGRGGGKGWIGREKEKISEDSKESVRERMWLSQVFFHSWTYSWQRAPPVGRLCHFPASPNRKKKNTEGGNAPERRTALRDRPHCGVSAFIITTYCTGLEDRSRGRWWSYGLSCVDAGGQRVRREGHGVGQGDGTLQQGLDLKDSSRLKLIETLFVAFGVFHLKTLSLSLCLFLSLSLSIYHYLSLFLTLPSLSPKSDADSESD